MRGPHLWSWGRCVLLVRAGLLEKLLQVGVLAAYLEGQLALGRRRGGRHGGGGRGRRLRDLLGSGPRLHGRLRLHGRVPVHRRREGHALHGARDGPLPHAGIREMLRPHRGGHAGVRHALHRAVLRWEPVHGRRREGGGLAVRPGRDGVVRRGHGTPVAPLPLTPAVHSLRGGNTRVAGGGRRGPGRRGLQQPHAEHSCPETPPGAAPAARHEAARHLRPPKPDRGRPARPCPSAVASARLELAVACCGSGRGQARWNWTLKDVSHALPTATIRAGARGRHNSVGTPSKRSRRRAWPRQGRMWMRRRLRRPPALRYVTGTTKDAPIAGHSRGGARARQADEASPRSAASNPNKRWS